MSEDSKVDEVIEKYVRAGKVVSKVRDEAVKLVKVGASILEVAEFVERRIVEEGCKPAFPVNISLNDAAAHVTPKRNDDAVFGEDVVKIDLGAHIDGYIADAAVTIDLAGEKELVRASREALNAAIEILHAGVNTGEIGRVIEEVITGYGYKPISNLTGHGLMQYVQHAPPAIPNVHTEHGVVLEAGDIIALEPFATNGAGRVVEGRLKEIYHLIGKKPVRHPAARKLLEQILGYNGLPFAKRWLEGQRVDFALLQLERAGVVAGYPVLKDAAGGMVSQAEHTVIITENGCEVITK
jgi:methionyl aminopeptidase